MWPERNFYRLADVGKLPVRKHIISFSVSIHLDPQIRLYLMGRGSEKYWGDKIAPLKHYGKHGRLDFRSVKLYADGQCSSGFVLVLHSL